MSIHSPAPHVPAACLAFQYAIQDAGTLDTEKVRDALAKLDVTTFYGMLSPDEGEILVDGETVTVGSPRPRSSTSR